MKVSQKGLETQSWSGNIGRHSFAKEPHANKTWESWITFACRFAVIDLQILTKREFVWREVYCGQLYLESSTGEFYRREFYWRVFGCEKRVQLKSPWTKSYCWSTFCRKVPEAVRVSDTSRRAFDECWPTILSDCWLHLPDRPIRLLVAPTDLAFGPLNPPVLTNHSLPAAWHTSAVGDRCW